MALNDDKAVATAIAGKPTDTQTAAVRYVDRADCAETFADSINGIIGTGVCDDDAFRGHVGRYFDERQRLQSLDEDFNAIMRWNENRDDRLTHRLAARSSDPLRVG